MPRGLVIATLITAVLVLAGVVALIGVSGRSGTDLQVAGAAGSTTSPSTTRPTTTRLPTSSVTTTTRPSITTRPSSTTTTTFVTTTTPPPPELDAATPLSLDGIGPVRVGMTITQAEVSARMTMTVRTSVEPSCAIGYFAAGPPNLSFIIIDGVVRVARVEGPPLRTKSGIGVGSTEAEVFAAYPGQIASARHQYDPAGHYLDYLPRDEKDQAYRLRFATNGSTVEYIQAGFTEEVQLVETCS
jgi:hypothetical protein